MAERSAVTQIRPLAEAEALLGRLGPEGLLSDVWVVVIKRGPRGARVLTREAVEAGALLEMPVLDHLVFGHGPGRWVSMREQRLGFE